MERVLLGRTGLSVSVAGLGCGGHSRLGQARGAGEARSIAIVRRALDLGINYLDTAQSYGTEEIVGKALQGRRDEVIVSTKIQPRPPGGGPLLSPSALREGVEASLLRLRTDRIDVFHLHGVEVDTEVHSREQLLPVLRDLRTAGKIRFLAVSEAFARDPRHEALLRCLDDGYDVFMLGFNLLNQTAARGLLQEMRTRGIAIELMFAVRRVLSDSRALSQLVATLVKEGRIAPEVIDPANPLGFLVHDGGAQSVVEAAYRFARHQSGAHVVLTGTGSITHLEENVASINRGPLPPEDVSKIQLLFGNLDHLTGN
jgi:L-galactose dehydrogenase